ncbi:MAG: hypothetical protein JW814_09660 [Candidatus Krumholzibacteriota bacterium]|nr:hypothetical protein [Candidatus Krumholzibacteriota bacterium]
MPERKRSNRIQDVSHLFLSGRSRPGEKEKRSFESLIYLYVSGEPCYRAYISAGIAMAVSSENIPVTLLESGDSMPNAGYYFSLEPGKYLSTTMGNVKGFRERINDHLRYSYAARRIDLQQYSDPFSLPSGIQMKIEAFGYGTSFDRDGAIRRISFLRAGKSGESDRSDRERTVFAVFDFGEEDSTIDHIVSGFIKKYPGQPVFLISREERTPKPDQGGDLRYLEIPSNFGEDLGRRIPPVSPFIKGIAISIIQSIASNDRRKRRDAVI